MVNSRRVSESYVIGFDDLMQKVAEREGFEPSVQFPVRILSKDVPSATRPSLQQKQCSTKHISRTEGEGFEPPIRFHA